VNSPLYIIKKERRNINMYKNIDININPNMDSNTLTTEIKKALKEILEFVPEGYTTRDVIIVYTYYEIYEIQISEIKRITITEDLDEGISLAIKTENNFYYIPLYKIEHINVQRHLRRLF
jgi:hypothetical protein